MRITRRQALAALAGIGAGWAEPAQAALPRGAAAPASAWHQLSRSLGGRLIMPTDPRFRSTAALFDPRWDQVTPAAVARIASPLEAAAVVRFAAEHGYVLRPRSGGHSYVGASTGPNVIVIDTRLRTGIQFDVDGNVSIGAGMRLYDVHAALAARGRTIPTGTCPGVGIAGLTLGGGLGMESRALGLTSDSLVGATIVTADGAVRTIRGNRDADLLWACRGGGGGNFGVVTDLLFRPSMAGNRASFAAYYPTRSLVAVLTGWARWMASASRDLTAAIRISGSTIRILAICAPGREHAHATSMAGQLGRPLSISYARRSYLDTVRFLGGGTSSPRQGWAAGSDVIRTLDSSAAHRIGQALRDAAARGITVTALLDPLSGKASAVASGGTAFPWRGMTCTVQWYVGIGSTDPARYAAAYAAINRIHAILGPASVGGYVNYLEPGRTPSSYYAANVERLRTIKRRYDPHNRFRSGASLY